MKPDSPFPLCCWGFRRQPVMAYAAGDPAGRIRALSLFPRTSFKRCLFSQGVRLLMTLRLDAAFCSWRESAGDLLSSEELESLLGELRKTCGGREIDWLLAWPAQTDRKRVYLIFRVPAERVSGVVKIGGGEFNRAQFRNETDVLARLLAWEHPFSIPSVLFECNLAGGRTALALGGFPTPLRPVSVARAVAFGREAIDHLHTLPTPAAKMRLGETSWFPAFRDMTLAGAASCRLLDLAATEINVAFVHGDLGPGNMQDDGRGGVFLFDWENASMQAPVWTDSVGLWLACRQRQVLRAPRRMGPALRKQLGDPPENDVGVALAFLCAQGNLAAARMLECGE